MTSGHARKPAGQLGAGQSGSGVTSVESGIEPRTVRGRGFARRMAGGLGPRPDRRATTGEARGGFKGRIPVAISGLLSAVIPGEGDSYAAPGQMTRFLLRAGRSCSRELVRERRITDRQTRAPVRFAPVGFGVSDRSALDPEQACPLAEPGGAGSASLRKIRVATQKLANSASCPPEANCAVRRPAPLSQPRQRQP